MEKVESIDKFYSGKNIWVPDNLKNEIGHFNVFRLDPFIGKNANPVPYRRRDYYKITLIIGCGRVHYADKVIDVNHHALVFSNPLIPYSWENTNNMRSGYFCIFNQNLFYQYGNLTQYEVFQPNGTHVFEIKMEQLNPICNVFERMLQEIDSEYIHKYDVLRNQVFELIHFALKLHPTTFFDTHTKDASQRITTLFLELLERQFPIDDNHQKINLRSPSEYASQLNIHVNHLNRAVKKITQRTTSTIIAERILKESKILLKHADWNVSEIAYALGFNETTHFNNFFKKHLMQSPLKFRNV
jgi:AraC family transcriptional activator of pobA